MSTNKNPVDKNKGSGQVDPRKVNQPPPAAPSTVKVGKTSDKTGAGPSQGKEKVSGAQAEQSNKKAGKQKVEEKKDEAAGDQSAAAAKVLFAELNVRATEGGCEKCYAFETINVLIFHASAIGGLEAFHRLERHDQANARHAHWNQ